MLNKEQEEQIRQGVESMKEEEAPAFLIEDYVFDMTMQFEDENKLTQVNKIKE